MTTARQDVALTLSIAWMGIAVIAFASTAGVLQWTRADLHPIAMPLSAYLRGPGGAYLRGAYDLMASALLCLAWASHRVTRRDLRSVLASVLLIVTGLALPIVAITVLYESTPGENLARLLHGVAAQATFLCLVIGMLLVSSRWWPDPAMRPGRLIGVVLAWLAFVQMWVLALVPALPQGLTQKALIGLIVLWLAWVVRQMWRRRSHD